MRLERPIRAALVAAGVVGVFTLLTCDLQVGQPTSELRAIAAIRTIQTAQTQYYSQFRCYAMSLAELGPPASGVANASTADLIGADLAGGKGNGYIFNVAGSQAWYSVQARPVVFGRGARRTFYSDQTMAVHQHSAPEPATVHDPELK